MKVNCRSIPWEEHYKQNKQLWIKLVEEFVKRILITYFGKNNMTLKLWIQYLGEVEGGKLYHFLIKEVKETWVPVEPVKASIFSP